MKTMNRIEKLENTLHHCVMDLERVMVEELKYEEDVLARHGNQLQNIDHRLSRIENGKTTQDVGLLEKLTDREIEVLREIGKGKRTKEIASDLGISKHTVQRHKANVSRKLKIYGDANLASFAKRAGLVSGA